MAMLSLCLSGPAKSASVENLLNGIIFAKEELENATKTERSGVLSLCAEAMSSAGDSGFWRSLAYDCSEFTVAAIFEVFGRSFVEGCAQEISIQSFIESASRRAGEDDSVILHDIKLILAREIAIYMETRSASPNCRETAKKMYIEYYQ